MATPTVVAVYGVPTGPDDSARGRVQRLGGGILPSPELVVVGSSLAKLLAAAHPPRVVRVGLGSHDEEHSTFVELREVSQVLESVPTRHGRMWALELETPARSPALFDTEGPPHPAGHELDADGLADVLRQFDHDDLGRPGFPPSPSFRPRPKPPHPHPHPMSLWCRLFPSASFCPHRA